MVNEIKSKRANGVMKPIEYLPAFLFRLARRRLQSKKEMPAKFFPALLLLKPMFAVPDTYYEGQNALETQVSDALVKSKMEPSAA